MSTLLFVWIVSAATLFGLAVYARKNANAQGHAHEVGKLRAGDVVTKEITALHRDFYKLLEHMKPHGQRSISAGLVMAKRGQELIISRVYGRVQSEKGRAASFFLKQIAEFKEKDAGRESGSRLM